MSADAFDEDHHRRAAFTRRLMMAGALQGAALALLAGRLFQVQVVQGEDYGPRADRNRFGVQILPPQRGRIVDRNGIVLAANREALQAVLIPSLAGNVRAAIEAFQRIVPLRNEDVQKILGRIRRQSRFLPVVLAHDLPFDTIATLNLLAPQLPGIRTEVSWRRVYLDGARSAHAIGYVGGGETADIAEDPLMRLAEMRTGKAGIEAASESVLRGKGGLQKIEVDARGHILRELDRIEPVDGDDLTVAIDIGLQRRVADRLARERRAAAVVVDIETGQVLAMGSQPVFDPAFSGPGVWHGREGTPDTDSDLPMLNRAIAGEYPPASTFKLVTALAALEAGAVKPADTITCRGSHTLAGQKFRCWKRSGHGRVDLDRALAESCDVYFYRIGQKIGIEAIAAMAAKLGFGRTYDQALGEQRPGLIPDPDWKYARTGERWFGGETLLAAIGQGHVLATPLQLAVMTARVASGMAVSPSLVLAEGGKSVARKPFKQLDISQGSLKSVRDGMMAAVNGRNATGTEAGLGAGRPLVCGKTGTAQVRRSRDFENPEEALWQQRDHSLFVGYMPAEAPRYALAVIVEHGGQGSKAAAPLARDIFEFLLMAPPPVRPPNGLQPGQADLDPPAKPDPGRAS